MSLREAARAIGARVPEADRALSGVSTDTRTLERGALFFALRGPNHDGHAFAAAAEAAGAAALVVERPVASGLPVLMVPDVRAALGHLAAEWRRRFAVPVVAITGSNGKTTVKELVAAVLGGVGSVLATRGNLNNRIGVPLSVLGLRPGHDFAVFELGTSEPGEIAALAAIVQPDVALVTGCAPAHLEGLGSLAGVVEEKSAVYRALPPDGVAVVNVDDAAAGSLRAAAGARPTVTFSVGREAHVRVHDLGPAPRGRRLALETAGWRETCVVGLHGPHVATNVAAACAVAHALGVPAGRWPEGLSRMRPVPGRLALRRGAAGSTVLDDTYNANPGSLAAALAALAELPGRRWLVLGDMAELGAGGPQAHREAGIQAREAGVERLFACGRLAALAAEAFGPGGSRHDDVVALAEVLRAELGEDVAVLVKGSRSAGLERLVARLEEERASC